MLNDFEVQERLLALVEEYKNQRESLKEIITDLEKFRTHLDRLFPETLDKRMVMFFQEKVKAVTELYKAILDIRKEISKNIKDEFELVRKLEIEDGEDDKKISNVRALAKEIEKLAKEDKEEQSDEERNVA